jgi:hypothetical protein
MVEQLVLLKADLLVVEMAEGLDDHLVGLKALHWVGMSAVLKVYSKAASTVQKWVVVKVALLVNSTVAQLVVTWADQ